MSLGAAIRDAARNSTAVAELEELPSTQRGTHDPDKTVARARP
jgi:hypothetical protein